MIQSIQNLKRGKAKWQQKSGKWLLLVSTDWKGKKGLLVHCSRSYGYVHFLKLQLSLTPITSIHMYVIL